jgi:hypothetical protein
MLWQNLNILLCTEPKITEDMGKNGTNCMLKMIGKTEPSVSTHKDVFDHA